MELLQGSGKLSAPQPQRAPRGTRRAAGDPCPHHRALTMSAAARGAAALTASDLTALLSAQALSPSSRAVLGLRGTRSCLALARLLADSHPHITPVVAAGDDAAEAAARAALPGAVFAPAGLARAAAMRAYAAEAVRGGVRTLVLPSTRVDAAVTAMGMAAGEPRKGGGARILRMGIGGGSAAGLRPVEDEVAHCEMLPPGVLGVVRPFLGVPPEVLDATVAGLGGGKGDGDGDGMEMGEVDRARAMLGEVELGEAIAAGERRRTVFEELRCASDALLRDAVVDVSHWGYIAVCRETLARAYADVEGGGRELAADVLARLIMHVTGVERKLSFSTPLVQRLAEEILQTHGLVPTGRTLCGALLRPATGPSADSFHRRNQRRRGVRISSQRAYRAGGKRAVSDRRAQREQEEQQGIGGRERLPVGVSPYAAPPNADQRDLLVLSREPDRESSHLRVKRMGGNISAMPIPIGRENAMYWDNRYVLSAAPADELAQDSPVVSDETVLLAALSAPQAIEDGLWAESSFYVRQLRHIDWEYINSTNESVRMRNFRAPYQCIRGLPAIYQKQVGDLDPGVLAAVPHLGLSGRPDMVFTAVRLPRYRCIPADMEPGFQVLPDITMESRDSIKHSAPPRRQERGAV